jgi:glycosyltransferase involved in cell wall biosynthesis
LPVLEAMRCGTAVVAGDASALAEAAGNAALVVSPNDPATIAKALLRLLTDPLLRQDLTRQGIARAARFTWEATAAQTLKVYESLMPRPSHA